MGKVWGNSWDGDRNPNNLCPLSLLPLTLTLSSLSNSEDWPAELHTPVSGSLSSPKAVASPGHRADFSPTQLPPGQMQFFLIDLPPGHGRTSKEEGMVGSGSPFFTYPGKGFSVVCSHQGKLLAPRDRSRAPSPIFCFPSLEFIDSGFWLLPFGLFSRRSRVLKGRGRTRIEIV